MDEQQVLDIVVSKARAVCPQVRKVMLFGSRARGDALPDSDYDILVVVPEADRDRLRGGELRLALWGVKASFDLVVMSEREFRAFERSRGYYARQIRTERKVLLEAA